MTEAEAKVRWCPFASSRIIRFYDPKTGEIESRHAGPGIGTTSTLCLGSSCMAFRVQHNPPSVYCGLAGKP